MLDLSHIAVIDNHCHPVLLQQQMSPVQFRRHFSEANHPSFAEQHISHTVYYRWLLRQLAELYGCLVLEEEIVEARNSLSAEALLQRLWLTTNIDTLILDAAFPLPELCFTPERMAELTGCYCAKMLRLETLMERLVLAHNDFDEMVAHFEDEISSLRSKGYCALKSIAAYRTGLNIRFWPKDEAVTAFHEARVLCVQTGRLHIAQKPLIDYLLHKAFVSASTQQLPIQFHTGYGDSDTDMRLGNPLELREILEYAEYQEMSVVLLHESYPYTQLGAYLAAVYPQVYFDLSYMIPFVEKQEMLAFTRQALSVAPVSKLMYSSDGIHVPEMHWAGAVRGRAVLTQVLEEMIAGDELDEQDAYHFANLLLRETASTLYKLT